MSYTNVICKVLNSSRKIRNIEEFENYVMDAYMFRITCLNFWPMNDSVHRMWAHCIYKIRKLHGFSTGLISEGPLECMVCMYSLNGNEKKLIGHRA